MSPTACSGSNTWPPRRRSTSGPTPRQGTLAAKAVVRRHVAHLDEDRPLYPDHNTMQALVRRREILETVEEAIGPLDPY